MNPQPVSLADEMRKLANKLKGYAWNDGLCVDPDLDELAEEFCALLAQHVVAEPQRAFVCPSCGKTFSDISYAPNGILCPDCPPAARAAEQPKLTELDDDKL